MSPAPLPVLLTHWASQLLQDEGPGRGGGGLGGIYLSLLCCFLPRPGCPADTPIYVKSQWLPQPGQLSLEPIPPHPSVPEGTTPCPIKWSTCNHSPISWQGVIPVGLGHLLCVPPFTRGSCRMGGPCLSLSGAPLPARATTAARPQRDSEASGDARVALGDSQSLVHIRHLIMSEKTFKSLTLFKLEDSFAFP